MGLSFLSQSVQSAKLEMVGIHLPHPHPVRSTGVSALSCSSGQDSNCFYQDFSAVPLCSCHVGTAIPAVLKDTRVLGLEDGMPKSKIWLALMT